MLRQIAEAEAIVMRIGVRPEDFDDTRATSKQLRAQRAFDKMTLRKPMHE